MRWYSCDLSSLDQRIWFNADKENDSIVGTMGRRLVRAICNLMTNPALAYSLQGCETHSHPPFPPLIGRDEKAWYGWVQEVKTRSLFLHVCRFRAQEPPISAQKASSSESPSYICTISHRVLSLAV
jgi:hypothetical protein